MTRTTSRTRADRCPGVLRPWPADDGLLVRLRLVGGRVRSDALRSLVAVAEEYADGRVHLTGRANLQVRALSGRATDRSRLDDAALAAIERTGLLPSRSHELVRNIMVSPQSGLAGGRADLRPIAAQLDRLLCADPRLAGLPGRFLFVLDDRGDLRNRPCDLGATALDADRAQLRVGDGWGPVVPLADVPGEIVRLALTFLERRGDGPEAPWHIAELTDPLEPLAPPDPGLPPPTPPLRPGPVRGGRHVVVPDGILARPLVDVLAAQAQELIVTPWRGVLVPEETA